MPIGSNELSANILVVDDDRDIRELLAELLRKNAFRVLLAKDGIEMQKRLKESPVDLIVLDVMMPGEDGLSLLRRLPTLINPTPPVLILSAKGEDVDRILGLEMGSDDYLVKPFHPRELLARIKSVLKRKAGVVDSKHDKPDAVVFGGWLFDRTRRRLWGLPDGVSMEDKLSLLSDNPEPKNKNIQMPAEELNTIEYRLLKALTDHPQRVLSRDFLLDATLGREHIPTDRTIDVQMSRLRSRLGDNARQASLIRTVRYEGYMLTSAVEKI